METTRWSEKGQMVIPKRVREIHGWERGIEFVIEELEDATFDKMMIKKASKLTSVKRITP